MKNKLSNLQAVQMKVLGDVSARLAEHFDHFAILVVPGGGGEKLGIPQWTFNGNHCLLVGATEYMKLHIAGARPAAEKKIDRSKPGTGEA